ncbi:peptide-methionine (S)-S-oxide reductase MsrA [Rickettsiales endosymbiont of Stachyamoeba lipophora]|uniref:peptide-methionine (S)-S-oxide reductase MsrA n=1 Tax=Rickettsiales endosymbiont of Stachyamoeba lipophora TaxID=2486578 RepID=UPI000F645B1E|nr:peptide-methionine (S)-S-oxide reductase MsrA [Rickettsiales endosymbiont of Stachyamoeba lipophora]AZL15480.1 peptide-methionine (S)-S-oxide reductase [Rickettsiales endosymbiont of Stachyamoeba lipophora]
MKHFLTCRVSMLLLIINLSHAMEDKQKNYEQVIFAGGCFWCTQAVFDSIEGVVETQVGYTGGEDVSPNYEQVCHGNTGHVEAVLVMYDPKQIGFQELLSVYWRSIDPVDSAGQFADVGNQYKTYIFYYNQTQKDLAEKSKREIATKLNHEVVTEIKQASIFYLAENYHQNYYKTNPTRYELYKHGSGRTMRLKELWGNYESSSK